MPKDTKNLCKSLSGRVVVGYRNMHTGELTKVVDKSNLITFHAADILANLMSGDARYGISHMYMQYENNSLDPAPGESISRSSDVSYFQATANFGLNRDWLRVPILTKGKVQKNPIDVTEFSGNSVTFVATSAAAGSTGENLVDFGYNAINPSKIFSLALVAAPDPLNKLNDVIFSRTNIPAVSSLEDSYIDIFWTITFN